VHRNFSILAILACCLFSCARNAEEPEAAGSALRQVVGRVAAVHAEDGFVLVQSFDDRRLPAGSLLVTPGDESGPASLKLTGERAGRYSAADILSGKPQSGQAVAISAQKVETSPDARPEDPAVEPEAATEMAPPAP
jgi:hypothetical protein